MIKCQFETKKNNTKFINGLNKNVETRDYNLNNKMYSISETLKNKYNIKEQNENRK